MSYNPPTGDELVACKAFKELATTVGKVRKTLSDAPFCDLDCAIDFAVRGVRTNGWMHLHSIIEALDALREYHAEVKRIAGKYNAAECNLYVLLREAEDVMSKWKRCPDCKPGAHGTHIKPGPFPDTGKWIDCETCNGKGMVSNGTSASNQTV